MSVPLVSVVLPVFNGEDLVDEALRSILEQCYRHLEVIVVDDGSTDATASVVERCTDPRVRLVRQSRRGPAAAMNRGAEFATGPLLARQDHDDLALPGRIERQVAFLDAHPEVALVGTWARVVRERGQWSRAIRHPIGSPALRFFLLFNNPFVHSSVMMRRQAFDAVGGYREGAEHQPEDYDLWARMARDFEVANLPEILQVYRERNNSVCRTTPDLLSEPVQRIAADNLAWWLGRRPDDPQIRMLARAGNGVALPDLSRAEARALLELVREVGRIVAGRSGRAPRELRRQVARRRRQTALALVRSWRLPVRVAHYADYGARQGVRRVLKAIRGG